MSDFLADPHPFDHPSGTQQRRQWELTPDQFRAFVTSTADNLYQMSPDWSEMRNMACHGVLSDSDQPNPDWLQEYVHPDDRELVVATYQEAVRGKQNFELVYRVRQVHGGFGWTRSRAVPIFDAQGDVCEWFGAAADITAQKEARNLLDEQALQFEMLLDNAPIGVCLVDQELRITSVNPIAMRVLGAVPDAIGRDFDQVIHLLWPEQYADEVVAMFRDTLQTGRANSTTERELPAGASMGTERHEWHFARIVLPGGGHGVVCYFKDISSLARSKWALQEADRRKDEFLATLAHELRTPLGPLRNCLHVLRLQQQQEARTHEPTATPADTRDLLTVMEQQVRHMVRLVDDLLEVSRITRGDIGLRREPIDLRQVLEATVDTSRQLADGAGHRLEVDLPPEPLQLHGDPVRLTQVVSNLINNAVKYTPAGGRIQVSGWREGDSAVVKVGDNGAGIPHDALANIFEMFVQGEHTRLQGMGGLGIGLTLVRNLVALHGGSVEARSDGPGRGSEFVVRLPLEEAHSDPVAPTASAEAVVEWRSILVIDDSHQNADTLALFLEMSGHSVRTAYDGASGLALAESLQPEVILLDLGMPGVDGFETCRRLRALPNGASMQVIAVTGWGQKNDRLRTAQSGFDHHLVKPVDPNALLELLATPACASSSA